MDATPSSTSSSDVERHDEIRRQSVADHNLTVSPCSPIRVNANAHAHIARQLQVEFKLTFRLSIFQDASSIVSANDPLDAWTLAQIANGNKDPRFLKANREERTVLMAGGMWPLEAPHPSDRPCHPDPEEREEVDLDSEERHPPTSNADDTLAGHALSLIHI